jgi:hypothetical protein
MALASVARYHSAQHARCSRAWRLCLSQTVATDLHSSSRPSPDESLQCRQEWKLPARMARAALRGLEGYLCHVALVDADRMQDQARTDSPAQSLMACHALRIAKGVDDIAHSLWVRRGFANRPFSPVPCSEFGRSPWLVRGHRSSRRQHEGSKRRHQCVSRAKRYGLC